MFSSGMIYTKVQILMMKKYVNICIQFKDGSIKKILCYAKFSFTYDKMADVFYEAFGYNIL